MPDARQRHFELAVHEVPRKWFGLLVKGYTLGYDMALTVLTGGTKSVHSTRLLAIYQALQ